MRSRIRPHPREARLGRGPHQSASAGKALSPDWQRWAARDLLRGVAPGDLVAALGRHGVPRALAEEAVAHILTSPLFEVAEQERARASKLALYGTLRRALDRGASSGDERSIERRSGVSAAEFFERYMRHNTPVILTDIVPRWRALHGLTPESLRDRFGSAEVGVMMDRDADPHCDRDIEAHARRVTFASFIDRALAVGESNDVYLVANNHVLEEPAFAPLVGDITPLPDILSPRITKGSACLWLGPKGTLTPLHHDASDILFCQVYGQKRVRMLPPWETWILDDLEGFYSPVDLDAPDHERFPALASAAIRDVTLSPGDALFLPVGWYHHVRALSMSISISFTGFAQRTDVAWYAPGNLR